MRSAYDVLGIAPTATDDQVKDAFRRFSKVLHPDVCKRATAPAEFKELKKAYDTLIDRTEREKHDYALAVVETKDVKREDIDDVLSSFEPKKKKKKKKKKDKVQAQQQQSYQQPYQPQQQAYPQYTQQSYGGYGNGNGEFEGIPDGFDNQCDLGGVL